MIFGRRGAERLDRHGRQIAKLREARRQQRETIIRLRRRMADLDKQVRHLTKQAERSRADSQAADRAARGAAQAAADAQRLATEQAQAFELLLLEFNAARRDIDAVSGVTP